MRGRSICRPDWLSIAAPGLTSMTASWRLAMDCECRTHVESHALRPGTKRRADEKLAYHLLILSPHTKQREVTMVLWGAICGGILGLLWPGRGWEFQMVLGAVLGAV